MSGHVHERDLMFVAVDALRRRSSAASMPVLGQGDVCLHLFKKKDVCQPGLVSLACAA